MIYWKNETEIIEYNKYVKYEEERKGKEEKLKKIYNEKKAKKTTKKKKIRDGIKKREIITIEKEKMKIPKEKYPRKEDTEKRLDRPFDPDILKEAEKIFKRYTISITGNNIIKYKGEVIEIPTVAVFDKESVEVCYNDLKKATIGVIAVMLEMGLKIPLAIKGNIVTGR